MAYTATITLKIDKDGTEFTSVSSVHPNLDYDGMHALQRTVAESLLSMGDVETAKAAKK